MATKHLPPISEYLNANENALRANPPVLMFQNYAADPVNAWRYVLRQFGAGLADYPDAEIYEIQGNVYGSLVVTPCLLCNAKIPLNNKQVINILWEKIKEVRNRA